MNRRLHLLLPLFTAGLALANEPAAAPAEAPAGDATPAAVTPPRYELKNKSGFAVAPETRVPFWPIGWQKGGPVAATPVTPQIQLDPEMFKVTSILLGGLPIAVINGRSYEEGQFLRLPKGSTVRIRVYRIGDGKVWLQAGEQILAVGLKRPELNERKGDTELLNEEKDDYSPELLKSISAK
jgi:hypothetical protein